MADGRQLARLRALAAEVACEWGLELGPAFPLSRYSYVAPAGDGMVLKVTPAEDDESDQESDALALWAGDGAVRLLRSDRPRRALLLERAWPGDDLSTLPERRATDLAVAVGVRLWRPAGGQFRWIGDHVPGWLERASPTSAAGCELLTAARRLYDPERVGRTTLVHGDLHHHNILDAGGRHVAIDPKPMAGEPEFDVASFLWNPLGSTITRERTEQRLDAFAAAGLDQQRMRRWAVIRGAYLGVNAGAARLLLSLPDTPPARRPTGTGSRRAPARARAPRAD